MHTVNLLEEALGAIRKLGYRIREECVGGGGGGSCTIHGEKMFFLDPTLDLTDQLDVVCETLHADVAEETVSLSADLRWMVGARKAA